MNAFALHLYRYKMVAAKKVCGGETRGREGEKFKNSFHSSYIKEHRLFTVKWCHYKRIIDFGEHDPRRNPDRKKIIIDNKILQNNSALVIFFFFSKLSYHLRLWVLWSQDFYGPSWLTTDSPYFSDSLLVFFVPTRTSTLWFRIYILVIPSHLVPSLTRNLSLRVESFVPSPQLLAHSDC